MVTSVRWNDGPSTAKPLCKSVFSGLEPIKPVNFGNNLSRYFWSAAVTLVALCPAIAFPICARAKRI
jgi:hypothetical protein